MYGKYVTEIVLVAKKEFSLINIYLRVRTPAEPKEDDGIFIPGLFEDGEMLCGLPPYESSWAEVLDLVELESSHDMAPNSEGQCNRKSVL